MAFAGRAPNIEGSLTRHLRRRFMAQGYDDHTEVEPPPRDDERTHELFKMTKDWQDAPDAGIERMPSGEPEMLTIARSIHKKKGSWWRLPKGLQDDDQ